MWIFIIRNQVVKKILKKKNDIEGEKVVGKKTTASLKLEFFSLQNKKFIMVIYISLILAILTLIGVAIK